MADELGRLDRLHAEADEAEGPRPDRPPRADASRRMPDPDARRSEPGGQHSEAAGGMWQWEDLIQTLHDTLELARIRAVEPEQLQDDVYGELLPLIIGEQEPWGDEDTDPSPATSDHRVFLDFGAIVPSGGPQ